ncbi:hypothetical protein VA7868_04342 [Vibrio aerogenes CECT 7868]|uniref:Uncharacterized protein n=1 Tax=Vibrio aerogenes CECT 7868 TaxID=1216006 RepID=A0A1M6DXN3_9VIBR|nr:hypothetical protein VA7868_04342 [Vibrio aerogenes CECT 7868]
MISLFTLLRLSHSEQPENTPLSAKIFHGESSLRKTRISQLNSKYLNPDIQQT